MPERKTMARARRDKAQGKAPSTQAGEFVREEIDHVRAGKHGARSAKQAIAIGLSKARKAGVKIPARGKSASKKSGSGSGSASRPARRPSARRSRAVTRELKREPRASASRRALSRQAKSAARKRSPAQRSASARKAARTRARE